MWCTISPAPPIKRLQGSIAIVKTAPEASLQSSVLFMKGVRVASVVHGGPARQPECKRGHLQINPSLRSMGLGSSLIYHLNWDELERWP